jgi:hypothetical protein
MTRTFTWLLALLLPTAAYAQISPDSPLVQALREGRATAPLPESGGAQLVARKIREKTGSPGEVTVEFVRIVRFETQPRCGRVGYGLYQKSSNTFWGQFGGQMNICDDGAPPQRQCKGQPELVAANTQCQDGSQPVDTAELNTAIAKAVAGGSLTGAQFKAQFDAQLKKSRGQP